MKKTVSAVISLFLIFLCFFGCHRYEEADITVDLSSVPVSPEANIQDIPAKETVRVDFIVPEKGCLKLLSYDCTEYEQWPQDAPEAYVTFVNENNRPLYSGIYVGEGYTEKCVFEEGTVTALINFKNYTSGMERFSLSWMFAPESVSLVNVEADSELPSVCISDENMQAKFTFEATQDAVYSFGCSEALRLEDDCSFYIENEDGVRMTGELSIHATEWWSRNVFLTKGIYTLTVCEINGAASVRAMTEKVYENVVTDAQIVPEAPVNLGFTATGSTNRSATFIADGKKKWLDVSVFGTDTYYDCNHTYTLKITDSDGAEIPLKETEEFYDYFEGDMRFDILDLKGKYTVTVEVTGACVMTITTV